MNTDHKEVYIDVDSTTSTENLENPIDNYVLINVILLLWFKKLLYKIT